MQIRKVAHLFSLIHPSSIDAIDGSIFDSKSDFFDFKQKDIQLDIKRDDLLHPIISGNKWRKIKYLLLHIESMGYSKVASMGGAHSNFLHVLSYVCHLLGWQCELSIRAFPEQALTPTLKDCIKWGAKLNFVDRKTFRAIREIQPDLPDDVFWIAEGGMHEQAVKGIKEILMELNTQYDTIVMASATGTSIAGLVQGAEIYQPHAKILGISVLNNSVQQKNDVTRLLGSPINNAHWSIIEGYEFGGFAKSSESLAQFISKFSDTSLIKLEPIYSGKSFYAVFDLLAKGYFPDHSKILLIHCGGLQGAR